MNSELTPTQFARRAISLLKDSGDSQSAESFKRFFKPNEEIRFYGIKTPRLRELERQVFQEIKKTWSVKEATEFSSILLKESYHESKALAILLLARFHRFFEPELLDTVKSWLSENRCANWAATDAISTLILTPLVKSFPELLGDLQEWTESENLWVRRAAAVSLTPLARKGLQLDTSYEIARRLFSYPEDLIHKAAGWLLREAGKTNPQRLEVFLLNHGPHIPRTALRYAIEKFPVEKRKQLLAQTK